MNCSFIKYFKEPIQKYNCFSFCLFYKEKYLKTNRNLKVYNATEKKIMKELYNNDIEKQNIDYGDFEIINIVKSSIYLKYLKMIPKHNFTYIDHNFELFKNKTIQNTYVIILSNINININLIDNYNYQ